MGFSQGNYSTSIPPTHNHISLSTKTPTLDECSEENDDIKIKSLFHKMIWDLGLSCFIQKTHRRPLSGEDQAEEKKVTGSNLEHNKAWLLAESGGSGTDLNSTEPHSVHSSFRFSFCSQVELETIKANSSSSATVLMVNLHNGMLDSKSGGDFSLKRIESLEKSISPVAHSLIRFNYAEIASATRNFTKGRVLGRGALSCVFRGRVGILRTAVAIKRLDKEDKESSKAFCRELMIASSLHNPHIVPLVGFCIDPEEGLFLVYKFVSGGSLERYLHEKKRGVKGGRPALPWSVRYKVAVGIAEAIAYLHNGTERCIVHRDIKPSNILLSSRKSAKLCDFGLAAWTPAPSVPFLCKTVKGTFGYLAPEYFQHGKVSDKTDVYAFGVVLLELLTGRKPIETSRGAGEENLVLWAKPLLQQGCNEKLLDPCLKLTERHSGRIDRMVQAAYECIHSEESRRPNMEEIIALLRGVELNCINRTKNGLVINRCISERYTQLQLTKSDMKSHLALAMVGVSESEEKMINSTADDDYEFFFKDYF